MCWSLEVSLTFGLLQLVALMYLVYRNHHYDRWYAFFCFPVMAQELCQAVLWAYVGKNIKTCSQANRTWSTVAAAFWGAVTTFIAFTAHGIADASPQRQPSERRAVLKGLIVISVLGYVLHIIVYRIFIMKSYCTYEGPCGHLNWGPATSPYHPTWIRIVYYLTYLLPILIIMVVTKAGDGRLDGRWVPWTTVSLGLVTIIPIYLYFNVFDKRCDPEEWSSVWCWSCSVVSIWFLTEVWVYRILIDPEWDAEENKRLGGSTKTRIAVIPTAESEGRRIK